MKKLRKIFALLLIVPLCFAMGGCSLEDLNMSTVATESSYTERNANYLSAEDAFEYGVEKGWYEDSAEGYAEFLSSLNYEQTTTDQVSAVNKALQSAVVIYCRFPVNSMYYSGRTGVACSGAGIIYQMDTSANGYSYIITNYHVVYNSDSTTSNKIASSIAAYTYGSQVDLGATGSVVISGETYAKDYSFAGDKLDCSFVGGSLNYDIAVLKVKTADILAINPTAVPVTIATGYSVGDTAIAIGNPETSGMSVTRGTVSIDSKYIELTGADETTTVNLRVMQIDTAVNRGNSGGGLFNAKGQWIGIVNAKNFESSDGLAVEGISYAIPYMNAKRVADNIISNCNGSTSTQVKKLTIGMSITISASEMQYDTTTGAIKIVETIKVESVTTNSLASKMGLQANDIITSIVHNGTTYQVERMFDLTESTLLVHQNDEVKINYTRNGVSYSTNLYTIGSSDISEVA